MTRCSDFNRGYWVEDPFEPSEDLECHRHDETGRECGSMVGDHDHCMGCGVKVAPDVLLCPPCDAADAAYEREALRSIYGVMTSDIDAADHIEHTHRAMDHAAFSAFEYRERD